MCFAKKKKKILLQCQGIAYYYMGLAAIYTKYPDRNVEVDVLFSSSKKGLNLGAFSDKIKQSEYINNVYTVSFKRPRLFDTLRTVPKNLKKYYDFHFKYKKIIVETIKEQLNFCETKYSEIFFSHEQGSMLITSLKFIYPRAKFVAFGDGSGLISGRKFAPTDEKIKDYIFFNEVKPDEIIALTVYLLDDSLNIKKIPIRGTDKNIYADLIKNDELLQQEVNSYTDEILNKYKNRYKAVLLTDNLDWYMYNMNEDEQINIYVDIIEKYSENGGVVILKTHPSNDELFVQQIKERCSKDIEIVELPLSLKKYPIEVFCNLLNNVDNIITFLSSSKISLSYVYGLKCIDAYDIIQKYPLKHYANIILNAYQTVCDRVSLWDKKSIVYEENIDPKLLEIHEKYIKNK